MGIRQLQYAQILEKELAKGTPFEKAQKIAIEKATVKSKIAPLRRSDSEAREQKKPSRLKRKKRFLFF